MENDYYCIINGKKTDASGFASAIRSGNTISAVKQLRELSGSDLASANAAVKAVKEADELPHEITFAGKGLVEIKFQGREILVDGQDKSSGRGCMGAAAALVALAVLPFFLKQ